MYVDIYVHYTTIGRHPLKMSDVIATDKYHCVLQEFPVVSLMPPVMVL